VRQRVHGARRVEAGAGGTVTAEARTALFRANSYRLCVAAGTNNITTNTACFTFPL